MKARFLIALAGLAIGFVFPVLAQEQSTVDPEVREQIEALHKKFYEAFNKHDAADIAALYTLDAVKVGDLADSSDTVSGQQAIEKAYAVEFASVPGELGGKVVQLYAIGNEMSAISEWSKGPFKGYIVRIYVHDADTWKIRLEYVILSMIPR
jgi:ketosteroid isomerase-like protein